MNAVCINQQPLEVKEWNGRRVVTFRDVDKCHGRKEGTARTNFKNNRKHFIANVDYFLVSREDKPMGKILPLEIPPKGITLLTETGYLMLVKSFTDDLAWNVQRELVNNYFRASTPTQQQLPVAVEEPKRFILGGQPGMLAKDLAKMLGITRADIDRVMIANDIKAHVLREKALANFKAQNDYHSCASRLMVFCWTAATNVAKALGVYEEHEAELTKFFEPFHNGNMTEKEMRYAIKQADIIYKAAWFLEDKDAREYALQAVTTLLINIGLWHDKCPGYNGVTPDFSFLTLEGRNKDAIVYNAKRRWPLEIAE